MQIISTSDFLDQKVIVFCVNRVNDPFQQQAFRVIAEIKVSTKSVIEGTSEDFSFPVRLYVEQLRIRFSPATISLLES